MLNTKTTLAYLAGQGGNPYKMTIASDALTAAGMLPADDRQPLNVDQAVNLLLGCCSPIAEDAAEFVRDRSRLTIEGGSETLHSALVDCLADDQLCPACVRVLHQKPFVAIHGTGEEDSTVMEFGESYSSGGFRNETVLSGGLLSLLAMKLKFVN